MYATVELWVGKNIVRLFSFFCTAASHTAHVQYFPHVCVELLYIHYCLEHVVVDFSLSFNVESIGDRERCKVQQFCVHQRTALYKSYLLLLNRSWSDRVLSTNVYNYGLE